MNILDILIDPSTGQKLLVDNEKQKFLNLDTELFFGAIKNGIPIILPRKTLIKSNDKNNLYSSFDYLSHYTKDSKVFNYAKGHIDNVSIEEEKRLHQYIISKIPDNAETILDIGCGNGWLSKSVQNDLNYLISVDISIENPQRAIKAIPHKNHSALVADAFYLPIANDSVDCIVASEIMEHVTDPKKFIEKLLLVIRRGGKLIITTPYNEKIPECLCINCNTLTPRHGHLHSFNEEKIEQIIPPNLQWKTLTFNNKYLNILRFNILLKYLPFVIWKQIDFFINKIIKKPLRLMIVIQK